ncbi:response regulator transcription factor [Dichotomicrobium thermohalophilum]|uniref:LuxR family two component transcriptional regulator n=1 Tax=Dichotomicrobium thermohalophilum TaxID=933063 RepID=A0A397QC81_9HYPH|nr:LuxR C-terminal-related transcriptional regulator [Dichotomicrobium thermohalophilum]RIA55704.1 LuxR family two component transcriptional regulator [Dichotomicrobium thermohalophilum]
MRQRDIVSVLTNEPEVIDALLSDSGLKIEFHDEFRSFMKAHAQRTAFCAMIDTHMSGVSVADLFTASVTETPILILSDADCSLARQAMELGAIHHINRPFSRSALLNAIDRIRMNGLTQDRPRSAVLHHDRELYQRLTVREREVMHLAINGHPNKEIGYRLGISQRTVEVHRARLMRKLNVRNLAELVRLCIENGWLSDA